MEATSWSPERKIVGAAIATIIVAVAQTAFGFDLPPGVEGAVGIVVGYLLPNKREG